MNIFFLNLKFFAKIKSNLFPFYKHKDLKKVFKILEQDQNPKTNVAMYVGGCVRKFLTNEKIDDIDIATIFTPEELKSKFINTNIRLIETGIEHGSVTLLTDNLKLEFTTLRQDSKTDGRHAEIQFTNDWREDSNRRDFTINSIYLNKNGKIFDPHLGIQDLKNNIVKFIGEPSKRIEEDYLRIIRFIRFSIKYKSEIEKSTIEAIKLNVNGIKKISKERILIELLKILDLSNFVEILRNEELKNIFLLIFPEFKYLVRLEKLNLVKGKLIIQKNLILGIMLLDETNNYEYFCHKYKVSKVVKGNLSMLFKAFLDFKNNKNFFTKNLKENIYYFGMENLKKIIILDFFVQKKSSIEECLSRIQNLKNMSLPKFPIDGKYLVKKGMAEGENIGKALKELELIWKKNDFKLSDKEIELVFNKFN